MEFDEKVQGCLFYIVGEIINGWYKYESRFALPVFAENGEVERYNVFHASMRISHANDGRLYLYDVLEIKKKQATLWNPKILLGKTQGGV